MRISDWSSDVCSSDLPFELRGEIGDLLLVGEQIACNLQTLPACAQRDILARDLCSQSETRIVRIGLRRAELRARRLDVPSRAAEEINLPQRVEPREEQRRGFGLSARHPPRCLDIPDRTSTRLNSNP